MPGIQRTTGQDKPIQRSSAFLLRGMLSPLRQGNSSRKTKGRKMQIKESSNPDKILIDCPICNSFFEFDDFRESDLRETIISVLESSRECPDCAEKKRQLQQEQEAEARRKAKDAILPELLIQAGIEKNYSHDRDTGELFKEPPCRYLAEWIYKNRNRNLLISGLTGCGKSTSSSFIATMLIRDGKSVVYTTLRKLLADWRAVKTSEKNYAAEKMLKNIFSNDLFIVDELVGKAKISESGQELLFELLEAVNSGACTAKIWLLGNFYEGSIEVIFSDSEPVRRRLQENFLCIYADKAMQTLTPLKVWKG